MRVSEKQLLMLLDVLKDSLRIKGAFGGYDLQVRLQLTNDLINQQSNDLKELDEKYFSSIRPPQSSSNDNSRFD